jgi:hypothetical protein
LRHSMNFAKAESRLMRCPKRPLNVADVMDSSDPRTQFPPRESPSVR